VVEVLFIKPRKGRPRDRSKKPTRSKREKQQQGEEEKKE
jgi:hypothetical protein